MKIEIEYEEVEFLKNENQRLKNENLTLQKELSSFSDNEKNRIIVREAKLLFEKYCVGIFSKIGFENGSVFWGYNDLDHYLGREWYDSEKLEVNIGAEITNKFKRAFIELGVLRNED